MPETDHPLKRFVALAASDVAGWLLGRPIRMYQRRRSGSLVGGAVAVMVALGVAPAQ